MTPSSSAYVPPGRKLEAISRRMHPIMNGFGWSVTMYGANVRYSIPMDASTTSNGLDLYCSRRTHCRCTGTASMCLTDGFTRARFRSLGYSTLGKSRFAGRVGKHPCRCVVTVPSHSWLRTFESTITCVSGKVWQVESKLVERGDRSLGAYRVDDRGEWTNYLIFDRLLGQGIVHMLPAEAVHPNEKCLACDWLFAGSLLFLCLDSEHAVPS